MYYDQVNDIYRVSKMGQIIKVQRPVSATYISGLYHRPLLPACISEAVFTIALLGVLLYKNGLHYKVKDHSLLDLTNKDLLMVYVYFLFFFYINIKRPQVGDRRKPV
jgi:hypothetical protein